MRVLKAIVPVLSLFLAAYAQVRLKDIASIEGVRDNALTGFGLVVGLNGTGDKDQTRFTTQSLTNVLAKNGISVDASSVKVKNTAFVMLQAKLPAFGQSGSMIDVTVSSMGDSSSLQGGTLLWTELKGVDGKTYAIAQGPVSTGGFSAGGGGSSVVVNHPTVGRIPNGGMIERSVDHDFLASNKIRFILDREDFTTMDRTVNAVNQFLGSEYARPLNSRLLEVLIPTEFAGNMVSLVSKLENLTVTPDTEATVVINEKTGTIIIGQKVRIDAVAIAHGGLTIAIRTDNLVVPSNAVVGGSPATQTNRDTNVQVRDAHLVVASESVTLGEIAHNLNALKVSPRDIIAILQAMKEAGALHAELKLI